MHCKFGTETSGRGTYLLKKFLFQEYLRSCAIIHQLFALFGYYFSQAEKSFDHKKIIIENPRRVRRIVLMPFVSIHTELLQMIFL